MKKYSVLGMTCSACSSRVEKAVSKVKGVSSCSVSFLTNSMSVEGNYSDDDIKKAVEKAGYSLKFENSKKEDKKDVLDTDFVNLKNRLIYSSILLIILFYISTGHMMFSMPLFILENNFLMQAIFQLLLATIIIFINRKFFTDGFNGLWHLSPNMNTLVAIGSLASYIYSCSSLYLMTDSVIAGDFVSGKSYLKDMYFESSAMILTLITFGRLLESISKGKTQNALFNLINLAPKTAFLLRENKEIEVPVEEVKKDDIFVVRDGKSIPVDGVIIEGFCSVDESSLTGESIPADKKERDFVYAGSILHSGFVKCKALKVGEDTALAQIIKLVSDSATTKAPSQRIADVVASVFVPVVMTISLITFLIWIFLGQTISFSLARAVSVLVISCPCALGLAVPVSIMTGSGVGAKNGILFKTASALEMTANINCMALDKTGTLTYGKPEVTDICPSDLSSENELISLAYSLEKKSSHPLAEAVTRYAEKNNIKFEEVSDFITSLGLGISAKTSFGIVYAGNFNFVSKYISISENTKKMAEKLSDEGKNLLFFASKEKEFGLIATADTLREETPKAVEELKNMGIKLFCLTGDNKRTAKAISNKAKIENFFAEILPAGKEKIVSSLKKYGKTAMVGDGVNDSPALKNADVGIAIGTGIDVAIDVADVVLMKSKLLDLPACIRLSRAVLRNIKENLAWAFLYNILCIPLATGLLIPICGLKLNPSWSALAMSLSSVSVVTNALRLNFVNIYDSSKDKKIKSVEENIMEKNIKIEGMSCGHCSSRVKKVLEKINGVVSASVSHSEGTAVVVLSEDVPNDILKKAIEDEDFSVVEIK